MADWRGRTPECLPFCQGGLHEEGCPVAQTLYELLPDGGCPTEGCRGDVRYAAPGRHHRVGCTHPLVLPEAP